MPEELEALEKRLKDDAPDAVVVGGGVFKDIPFLEKVHLLLPSPLPSLPLPFKLIVYFLFFRRRGGGGGAGAPLTLKPSIAAMATGRGTKAYTCER